MQAQTYHAAIGRNIASEMADHALERGEGLTFKDYRRLGYSADQIERNINEAADIYARRSMRRVA